MDNQVPLDKQRCVICKHSSATASKEPCKSCGNNDDGATANKFEPDWSQICKWCYNPVVPGDSVCEEHRKNHAANSWPGCVAEDQKKQSTTREIEEKKARRERIATAILAGVVAGPIGYAAKHPELLAIKHADALIAALDEVSAHFNPLGTFKEPDRHRTVILQDGTRIKTLD